MSVVRDESRQLKPFSLLVKPVGSRCNLACRYCFYMGTDEMLGEGRVPVMSQNVLERMLADYLGLGFSPSVITWQGGEPTVAGLDFYRSVVAAQAKYGGQGQMVGNGLQTNGFVIDDEWASFLAEYNFLVGLSLDGPEEVHDRYRRTVGDGPSFRRVMAAADSLRRHGVSFNILSMITDKSQNLGRELYTWLVGEGFEHLQFIPCVEHDPVTGEPSPYNVTPEGYGRFMSDVFDAWIQRDVGRVNVRTFEALVGRLAGEREIGICTIGTQCDHYLVVEKEGDVYPCDFFVDNGYRLGTVMEHSIADLYLSRRETAFSRIKGRMPRECRTCRWLDLCQGGCPKDRLCAGGGRFGEKTPLCEGLKIFYDHAGSRLREFAASVRLQRTAGIPITGRIGRNDPCPCGSGKKYKRCCGR